jgi:hypothetical protein
MANKKRFWLEMLAMALAFGMMLVACEVFGEKKSEDGTFTVKNIPAEYNGKYAFYGSSNINDSISSNVEDFIFGGNYDVSTGTATGVLISNRSVSLPVWEGNRNSGVVKRYYFDARNSNFTPGEAVRINDTATAASDEMSGTVRVSFYYVEFHHGHATKSWNNIKGIDITP